MLDRAFAEARLFPAVNVRASGTRKEEQLYSPQDYARLIQLRRRLANHTPKDALVATLKMLDQYATNEELLQGLPAVN